LDFDSIDTAMTSTHLGHEFAGRKYGYICPPVRGLYYKTNWTVNSVTRLDSCQNWCFCMILCCW
jgi:hypothetical protein